MLSSLPWHELKHAQHMPNYSNSKFQKILGTSESIYLFDILSLAVWSFDGNAESAPRSYQKIAYSEKISFLKRLFQNQFRSPCQWQCATLRTSFGFSGSTSFIVLSVLSSFSSSSKPSFTCKKCTLGQQTAGWQRGNRLQCLQTFLTRDYDTYDMCRNLQQNHIQQTYHSNISKIQNRFVILFWSGFCIQKCAKVWPSLQSRASSPFMKFMSDHVLQMHTGMFKN